SMDFPNNYPVPPGPMKPTPAAAQPLELIPWFWTRNPENEIWQQGGHSREEALAAIRHDRAVHRPEIGEEIAYIIGPGRRATQTDVDEWIGEDDLEVGDWLIDDQAMEDVPE
ncbi:MAG TPA: hypothetical protein VEC14_03295, partial [Reyranellaceae bacterium]|nr:hypothetical protein [Reyranellaceae bacterium]